MKPAIIGLLLGSALGFIASFFYLYSFWLPITAACILGCGIVGRLFFKTKLMPSIISSISAFIIYLGIFFAPAEIAAATAESPTDHAKAGFLLATRGGHFFGADRRAFEHYLIAAENGHMPSVMVVANACLYGHYGLRRDPSAARPWLEKASAAGIDEATKSLASTYHFPNKKSEPADIVNDEAAPHRD
jgi:hypothetical protein